MLCRGLIRNKLTTLAEWGEVYSWESLLDVVGLARSCDLFGGFEWISEVVLHVRDFVRVTSFGMCVCLYFVVDSG